MKDALPFLLSPLFLFFAPITVISMIASASLQSGSYERRTPRREKVFRLPDTFPIFLVSLFVFIAAMVSALLNPEVLRDLPTTVDWPFVKTHFTGKALAVGIFVVWLYGAALHWSHTTGALVLDVDRRRFRTLDMSVDLFKFRPPVRTGSWEEISGIAVRRASAKGTTSYLVVLKWRQASHLYSTLGGYAQPDKAAAYAQRLSNELGLPVVASP